MWMAPVVDFDNHTVEVRQKRINSTERRPQHLCNCFTVIAVTVTRVIYRCRRIIIDIYVQIKPTDKNMNNTEKNTATVIEKKESLPKNKQIREIIAHGISKKFDITNNTDPSG
jgi:hypothetical protein